MKSQFTSKSPVQSWARPLLLLGALASGCAGTGANHSSEAVVIGGASAEPTPDDLLHARLRTALAESAQVRASRRRALWMVQNRPTTRTESTEVRGTLPPIEIQRVVRANFGQFRQCYENGLSKNPKLSGRVAVRFIIDREGKVSNVGNGGSDLADEEVVACVVKAFHALVFPKPDGGIVTVVYPIMFSPGDSSSSASATASASAPPPSPPRPVAVAKVHSTAPIVVIDGSSIRIDGVEVGNVNAILDLGKMQKIDALFDTLKARREKWQAEHPGQAPDGIAGLRAESSTSQLVFKSVFQTMAFAGYPYIHVQNVSDPATIVEFGAQVPGPPDSSAQGEPAPELHVAFLTADEMAFIWKLGAVVLSEARVAKEQFFGTAICQNWNANGPQRKPKDDQQDLLVLHVGDRAKLDDVIRVAQAAEECTRDVLDAGGRIRKRPVFWNVLSVQ